MIVVFTGTTAQLLLALLEIIPVPALAPPGQEQKLGIMELRVKEEQAWTLMVRMITCPYPNFLTQPEHYLLFLLVLG